MTVIAVLVSLSQRTHHETSMAAFQFHRIYLVDRPISALHPPHTFHIAERFTSFLMRVRHIFFRQRTAQTGARYWKHIRFKFFPLIGAINLQV